MNLQRVFLFSSCRDGLCLSNTDCWDGILLESGHFHHFLSLTKGEGGVGSLETCFGSLDTPRSGGGWRQLSGGAAVSSRFPSSPGSHPSVPLPWTSQILAMGMMFLGCVSAPLSIPLLPWAVRRGAARTLARS